MIIDLHGLTEQEAIPTILGALFSLDLNDETEVEIITGNGFVLKRVLEEILEEEGYPFELINSGSYIIYQK